LLLICACAGRPPAAPPAVPPAPADGGLRVTLAWMEPVDLDLYVTDPVGETLYFANNPTRAGARLQRDARCSTIASDASSNEVALIATPAPGRYRIGVDFIDACGGRRDTVPFRVVVDLGDRRREATGAVRLSEFKVIVLEFEVGEDGALR
jgi:hypothetical protein